MRPDSSGAASPLGILFAATIVIAIAGIHYHVVGAMVRPLGDAYGWSRGEVTFALTISSIVHPFTNIAVGWLADRLPARKIALPGIVGFCLGTALLGLAGPELWTWYAAYFVFALLAAGASNIIWTKLVVLHFTRRRGIALAASLAGTGILVSTVPSIVLALHEAFGLRGVYPALAALSLVLMLVPAWLFLPRYGSSARPAAARSGEQREFAAVVGSGRLWRLGLALVPVAACVGTFIAHFQPMLTDAGLSPSGAARVALFIGPAMIVGRLGTGLLFDILPPRLVAACAVALPAFACLWLWQLPLDATSASILAVLIGIGMGSEVDVVAYLSSRYFDTRHYGLVFGILISLYGAAIGTSAWLVGRAFDAYGTYDPALMILVAGIAIAVALVVSLGRAAPREVDGEALPA
jgi:predicted MFS family arabinose efflux permease